MALLVYHFFLKKHSTSHGKLSGVLHVGTTSTMLVKKMPWTLALPVQCVVAWAGTIVGQALGWRKGQLGNTRSKPTRTFGLPLWSLYLGTNRESNSRPAARKLAWLQQRYELVPVYQFSDSCLSLLWTCHWLVHVVLLNIWIFYVICEAECFVILVYY